MEKASVDVPIVYFDRWRTVVDLQTSSDELTRLLAPMRLEPLGDETLLEVDVAIGLLPGVHCWVGSIRQGFRVRLLSAEDRQVIYFPGGGRVEADTAAGPVTCDATHGINIEVATVSELRFSSGRDGVGMAFERPALIQRLAELLDAPVDRRLVFAPRFEASVGTRRAVEDMVRALTSPMLGAAMTASPETASKLSAVLVDLVLRSLPHNYSDALAQPRPRIAPRHVRQAVAYIRANARSPISVDRLAELCQVSVRSLQYGFRHFLDTSPAEYLRDRRLEGVRQDILMHRDIPVATLARRWGFTNTTRFAARFAASYGETPQAFRRRRDKGP